MLLVQHFCDSAASAAAKCFFSSTFFPSWMFGLDLKDSLLKVEVRVKVFVHFLFIISFWNDYSLWYSNVTTIIITIISIILNGTLPYSTFIVIDFYLQFVCFAHDQARH